jgi:hypothetical protein
MTAKTSYFMISFGLQGCYMPDSYTGAYSATTRREIVAALKDAIDFYDFPKTSIRQVSLKRLWDHAKKHGTSSLHFCIGHKHNMIEFHGLTKSEYDEHNENYDC